MILRPKSTAAFWTTVGPYGDLRQFHLQQVAEGRQTIRENIQSLQALLKVCLQMNGQSEPLGETDFGAVGM
ncbi:MAG: hypothetical protein ACO4AJ_16335, partial [Prochlorothrix sp.]